MLRQERLWIWMAALLTAGLGWNMHLVECVIELDFFGAASRAFGSDEATRAAALALHRLYEACLMGAVLLMSAGLLAEAADSRPKGCPADARA